MFFTTAQQQDDRFPVPAKIHPITGADVYPKLAHPLSDRLAIPKVSRLNLAQTNPDARLRHLVAQAIQPLGERLPSVIALVTTKFNHCV